MPHCCLAVTLVKGAESTWHAQNKASVDYDGTSLLTRNGMLQTDQCVVYLFAGIFNNALMTNLSASTQYFYRVGNPVSFLYCVDAHRPFTMTTHTSCIASLHVLQ